MVAPVGASPPARGTGSRAHPVIAAYRAPGGDGNAHRHGPTGWGDGSLAEAVVAAYGAPIGDGSTHHSDAAARGPGEPCRGGGRYLQSALGGGLHLAARTHRLRGRGVLPRSC